MWNLKDNKGNKIDHNATATFEFKTEDGLKKMMTCVIYRILKRQCEVAYFDENNKICFMKVATSKLTVVKYNKSDMNVGEILDEAKNNL